VDGCGDGLVLTPLFICSLLQGVLAFWGRETGWEVRTFDRSTLNSRGRVVLGYRVCLEFVLREIGHSAMSSDMTYMLRGHRSRRWGWVISLPKTRVGP
jgi:hypothetical protein